MPIRPSDEEEASPDLITDADRDVGNLLMRAGYLRGLAERTTGDDRIFLLRATRSLLAYAVHAAHCPAREEEETA